MTKNVLILGASGRFGSHCSNAFKDAGWSVRHYDRSTDMNVAAQGCDVIVNGLNPPNYENWETALPKITSQVLAAAKASGATVLVAGNVYNYGTQPGPWSANTPHVPCSKKGRIRVQMERDYHAAAKAGTRVIILRAGDFIDTEATGNFFDLVVVKNASKGKISYPGNPDIPHAWAYLPDLGRAAVALADRRDQLPLFADVPFEGWTLSGDEIAQHISALTDRTMTLKRMPWWPIRIASPFWRLGRELLEMRYLWNTPHALSDDAFAKLVPEFRATPVRIGLGRALPSDVDPDKTMIAADGLTFADQRK